jgi:hypothetical protein
MSDSDEEAQKQVLEAFGRITNSGIQLQFHIIEYLTASDRWVILKNRKNDSLLHRLILLNPSYTWDITAFVPLTKLEYYCEKLIDYCCTLPTGDNLSKN